MGCARVLWWVLHEQRSEDYILLWRPLGCLKPPPLWSPMCKSMASYMYGSWHAPRLLTSSLEEQTRLTAGHQSAVLQITEDDSKADLKWSGWHTDELQNMSGLVNDILLTERQVCVFSGENNIHMTMCSLIDCCICFPAHKADKISLLN